MTNPLPEVEQWDSEISQLETTDPALGGATGVLNRGPKQIANRLLYLLARTFGRDAGVAAGATYVLSATEWQKHLINITASVSGSTVVVPEPALTEARTKLFRNATANNVIVTTPLATSTFTLLPGQIVLLSFLRVDAITTLVAAGDAQSIISTARGGFGVSVAAATGIPKFASGVLSWLTAPTGALVGTTDTQTLSAKTLTSPTINSPTINTATINTATIDTPTLNGAITLTSFTSTTVTTADGKMTVTDASLTAQTTDGTQAAAYTSATLADGAVHVADVIVEAIKSDGSAAACYKAHYAGRRSGGTWTQLAAVVDNGTEETTASWDATLSVASNQFKVLVTGVAANTIRWGVSIRIQSMVP